MTGKPFIIFPGFPGAVGTLSTGWYVLHPGWSATCTNPTTHPTGRYPTDFNFTTLQKLSQSYCQQLKGYILRHKQLFVYPYHKLSILELDNIWLEFITGPKEWNFMQSFVIWLWILVCTEDPEANLEGFNDLLKGMDPPMCGLDRQHLCQWQFMWESTQIFCIEIRLVGPLAEFNIKTAASALEIETSQTL